MAKVTVHRKGWGRERWLHNADGYTFKILEFKSDSKSSLHYHLKKTETWYVESGIFEVTTLNKKADRRFRHLGAGAVLHLPAGTPHRVRCIKAGRIFEASTPHDEADTYRIEKGDSQ